MLACRIANIFPMTLPLDYRTRGPTLPLPYLVNKLTRFSADLYSLFDRGEIAVGRRADFNLIDHDALALHMPRTAFDLPMGGPRRLQGVSGYLATLVAGTVTRRNDTETDARPGRLVRSRPH